MRELDEYEVLISETRARLRITSEIFMAILSNSTIQNGSC